MTYPLNYNNLKDCNVKILYDEAIIYDYFYKAKDRFTKATSVANCELAPALLWSFYINNQGASFPCNIAFEGSFFRITKKKGRLNIVAIPEDEELKYKTIRFINICEALIGEQVLEGVLASPLADHHKEQLQQMLQYNTVADDVFKSQFVLSPATLRRANVEDSYYLKVDDVLLCDTLVKEGAFVKKGDILFEYTHEVTGMFGRKKIQKFAKKSECDGVLTWCLTKDKEIWARKDCLIAKINPK
ncbi:MAG: hypothetical protein ATN36_02650 [Epulopiscium sp. Nele67-Bin005]|nr:MAG: hypothetical protein ATN36_02650 [Epulopiscium sp. Nele67-Bin005]